MKKWYEKVRVISIILFALMVIAGIIRAPYVMYQETQSELQEYIVDHRPRLTIEPMFDGNGVTVYLNEQGAEFGMAHEINNIGALPAFETRIYTAMAPLDKPEEYFLTPVAYQSNAIHNGIPQIIEESYHGQYSIRDQKGLIMMCIYFEYSDMQEGGNIYSEYLWATIAIRFDKNNIQFEWVKEEWKNLHKPYVQELLDKELGRISE